MGSSSSKAAARKKETAEQQQLATATVTDAEQAGESKQKDNALICDLMEFFCFAVKESSTFRGTVLFIFQVQLATAVHRDCTRA